MAPCRILIYVLRRDLRLADNHVLHEISRSIQSSQNVPFTHLLPLYVFPAQQLEVSGFLSPGTKESPYPEARSQIGGFWRCGHHRAKFLAESVWDTKKALEKIGSGLEIRIGTIGQVVKDMLEGYKTLDDEVSAVWMTEEEGWEEEQEEEDVRNVVEAEGKQFRLLTDEKYFIDDRDIPFQKPGELPDVFTSYRKMVEPLRDAPRKSVPAPAPSTLPSLPASIPPQSSSFISPSSLEETISALLKPLNDDFDLTHPPTQPEDARSAFPFSGGEKVGHERIKHLITSGSMSAYKDTRNGLLGQDFSTKLSAWLALGCITARQVHEYLLDFENGTTQLGSDASGYGQGENKGTAAVRFELLWRDYMRLCTRKFGPRLFHVSGFRHDTSVAWNYIDADSVKSPNAKTEKHQHDRQNALSTAQVVHRFLQGRTGTGLIDASMRELFLTGYTSNRARQNVASYLAKHLRIDWRLGAEWYETHLVDYDVSSNWGNWQYNAGVGNDPRGEGRVFNPVKQAFDYDPQGEYIKMWVPELRGVEDPLAVFQAWKVPVEQRKELHLDGLDWVENPLKRIEFYVHKPSSLKAGGGGGGGSAGGGHHRGRQHEGGVSGSGGTAHGTSGGSSSNRRGRGWGRGRARGGGSRGRGGGGGSGGGGGGGGGGNGREGPSTRGQKPGERPGREQRMGQMDKAAALEEAVA